MSTTNSGWGERFARTAALESLLKGFARSIAGVAADAEALSASVAYQIKFYDDERSAAEKAHAEAASANERMARVLALAADMVAASRDRDMAELEKCARRMAACAGAGGQRTVMDAKLSSAASGYLRELARDGNWRHVEFVEDGRMQTLVLWNGPTSSDARHPAWLASKVLKWLLGEDVPASAGGRGIGYGLRGDIIQELSDADCADDSERED